MSKIEQEIEVLITERRHLEFHIERTGKSFRKNDLMDSKRKLIQNYAATPLVLSGLTISFK